MHAKWKGVGGQALVHGGRGWGPCPPLENILSEEILTSHLCFTNEIRGGGAIDTLYMQNERGWADMRLSMVGGGGWVWGGGGGRGGFAPLENKKRKGEYRPQSAVGGK